MGEGRQKGKRSKETKIDRHDEGTRTNTRKVETRRKAMGPDKTGTKKGIQKPRRESSARKVDTQKESTSSKITNRQRKERQKRDEKAMQEARADIHMQTKPRN